jgi:ACS family sodium-dependent inorganic phosphate cotransporter
MTEKGEKKRWSMIFALFVAFVLCNLDKVNMSVAIVPMAASFGWSSIEKGLVQSAFFWGYAFTQIPGRNPPPRVTNPFRDLPST